MAYNGAGIFNTAMREGGQSAPGGMGPVEQSITPQQSSSPPQGVVSDFVAARLADQQSRESQRQSTPGEPATAPSRIPPLVAAVMRGNAQIQGVTREKGVRTTMADVLSRMKITEHGDGTIDVKGAPPEFFEGRSLAADGKAKVEEPMSRVDAKLAEYLGAANAPSRSAQPSPAPAQPVSVEDIPVPGGMPANWSKIRELAGATQGADQPQPQSLVGSPAALPPPPPPPTPTPESSAGWVPPTAPDAPAASAEAATMSGNEKMYAINDATWGGSKRLPRPSDAEELVKTSEGLREITYLLGGNERHVRRYIDEAKTPHGRQRLTSAIARELVGLHSKLYASAAPAINNAQQDTNADLQRTNAARLMHENFLSNDLANYGTADQAVAIGKSRMTEAKLPWNNSMEQEIRGTHKAQSGKITSAQTQAVFSRIDKMSDEEVGGWNGDFEGWADGVEGALGIPLGDARAGAEKKFRAITKDRNEKKLKEAEAARKAEVDRANAVAVEARKVAAEARRNTIAETKQEKEDLKTKVDGIEGIRTRLVSNNKELNALAKEQNALEDAQNKEELKPERIKVMAKWLKAHKAWKSAGGKKEDEPLEPEKLNNRQLLGIQDKRKNLVDANDAETNSAYDKFREVFVNRRYDWATEEAITAATEALAKIKQPSDRKSVITYLKSKGLLNVRY